MSVSSQLTHQYGNTRFMLERKETQTYLTLYEYKGDGTWTEVQMWGAFEILQMLRQMLTFVAIPLQRYGDHAPAAKLELETIVRVLQAELERGVLK